MNLSLYDVTSHLCIGCVALLAPCWASNVFRLSGHTFLSVYPFHVACMRAAALSNFSPLMASSCCRVPSLQNRRVSCPYKPYFLRPTWGIEMGIWLQTLTGRFLHGTFTTCTSDIVSSNMALSVACNSQKTGN